MRERAIQTMGRNRAPISIASYSHLRFSINFILPARECCRLLQIKKNVFSFHVISEWLKLISYEIFMLWIFQDFHVIASSILMSTISGSNFFHSIGLCQNCLLSPAISILKESSDPLSVVHISAGCNRKNVTVMNRLMVFAAFLERAKYLHLNIKKIVHSRTSKLFSFVHRGDFCLSSLSIEHIQSALRPFLQSHSSFSSILLILLAPPNIISVQSSAHNLTLTLSAETAPFQGMSGPPPPYTSPYPPQTYSAPYNSQNYRMNDGVDPNALLAAGIVFSPWNISLCTIELILRACSCCLNKFVRNHIWITARHRTISNISSCSVVLASFPMTLLSKIPPGIGADSASVTIREQTVVIKEAWTLNRSAKNRGDESSWQLGNPSGLLYRVENEPFRSVQSDGSLAAVARLRIAGSFL